MKLAFIEIAGFRGFKDKTRFDFPSGFIVLTGRNGVGKSTVLDAVDFVLTGTINKYSVTGCQGRRPRQSYMVGGGRYVRGPVRDRRLCR
jgi:chromosome segregation protein